MKSWLRAGEPTLFGRFQAANNGVTIASGPPWVRNGRSWAFNGSGYLQVNNGPVLIRGSEWLIAASVKANAASGRDRAIYVERGSSGNDILKIEIRDSSAVSDPSCLRVTYRDDGGTLLQYAGDKVIADGSWHSVGAYRRGNSIVLFADGRQTKLSASWGGSDTFTDTVESRIGGDIADSNASMLSGDYVSEVLLLSRGFPIDSYLTDESPQRLVYDTSRGLAWQKRRPHPLIFLPAAGSFKSAWARNSNVILQPGVLT